MGALSRNDNGWDQGILFYLPNMTWLSPLGFSAQMISATYQSMLLPFADDERWNTSLDLLAVQSEDRMTTVLRVVNVMSEEVPVNVQLNGWHCGQAVVAASELYDDEQELSAVNPPSDVRRVAPRPGPPTMYDAATKVLKYT